MKGLVILDRAVMTDGPVSVSALARELSLPKSSVHRSLTTLREAGYLLFNEDDRRYYPSLKLAQMGRSVSENFPYRQAVLPFLSALASETWETAHFAFLDGKDTVFVASSVPNVSMASVIPDNFTLPWHKTAFGIAAASAIASGTADVSPHDPDVSAGALEALEEAKLHDNAAVLKIEDRGTFEIAAAIRTNWHTTIGVIGISGPASRFDDDTALTQLETVKKIAEQTFAEAKGAARTADTSAQ